MEILNEWVAGQCREAWQMRHPQWPEPTVENVLQDERTRLMPNPGPFDGYSEQTLSSTSLIHFQRNRYIDAAFPFRRAVATRRRCLRCPLPDQTA
ncbi:hypothetical protein PPGU19_099560 (plasmid) [Paraburkholderia sp. PGU19]|nr:hypothetical protein PPGU19_099560 [Paraburkholderia sp. PGU19]